MTYTNTGLRSGVNCYYVVTAVNATGESGNSKQAKERARVLRDWRRDREHY